MEKTNYEEELKKGCGRRFRWKEGKEIFWNCGDKTGCNELVRNSETIYLCPICKAKFEGYQKAKEDFIKKIDELEIFTDDYGRRLLEFFKGELKKNLELGKE